MGDLFQPWHIIILFMLSCFWILLVVIPFWQIYKKAGMSPALSILMIVPIVNLVMLYVLAFSQWRTPVSQYGQNYPRS